MNYISLLRGYDLIIQIIIIAGFINLIIITFVILNMIIRIMKYFRVKKKFYDSLKNNRSENENREE